MAIPLIAMAGLLAYAAGTSITNAINLDRVPNLINASGIPAAKFGGVVQSERAAAVVYLFAPDAANLAAYQKAIGATDKATPAFTATMTSHAVLGSEPPAGAREIETILSGLKQLPALRSAVRARAISPLNALGAYSQGPADTIKLFLIQTKSVDPPTNQQMPAVGLIATVQAREHLSQEYALLSGMLAGQRMTAADRVAFASMAAGRQAQLQYADNLMDPPSLAVWNAAQAGSAGLQKELAGIEQAIVAGTRVSRLPVTPAQWQGIVGPLMTDNFNGGLAVSQEIIKADHRIAHAAWVRVAVVCGLGLLGLLITILVTTLVARSIIRRLSGLERNALQLAEVQLPDVVGRLRRGDNVDVNAEAPALRIGRDEIGRVGQAFDLVRQTAIRAAVEEARLRQGINDVFRSLARRSQSLLHRQLSLLDQMERRATDPEALDDLFRLDHLTTRMRRHAEGLVILAGAPPGRGWSSPVRMVDVMRGAIAEVEDYARVSVATRSQAALAGSAVADVIHLLAELIENATTLSPPYTSVRVSGDTVANGFAIEVEDRGVGMSPSRLAELNERLANPPEFNPSDSEQLGLFVVSQLAKRHGIRITLKASPYGGTAAIVLIPRHLVVTEEAFRAGLPGEPASAGVAQLTANGNHAVPATPPISPAASIPLISSIPDTPAELTGPGSGAGFAEPGLPGLGQTPGVRISGPLRRSQGSTPEQTERGAHAASGPGAANGAPGDLPRRHDQPGGPGHVPNGAGAEPFGAASTFDVFTPRRHGPGTPETSPPDRAAPAADPGMPYPGNGPYIASPPHQASGRPPHPAPGRAGPPFAGTGSAPPSAPGPAVPFPGTGPAPYPDQPAPFPGWTLQNPPGDAPGRPASGPGAPAGPATTPMTPVTPVAPARPGQASRPPWELSREAGPLSSVPGGSAPGSAGPDAADPDGDGDVKGLPRRVRQASLAPQLRDDPPARRTTVISAGPRGAAGSRGPSPAEIRQTMSALQRGWQEGRSQRMAEHAAGGPPPGADPGTPGVAGPDTPAGGSGGRDSTANEEAREGSDES